MPERSCRDSHRATHAHFRTDPRPGQRPTTVRWPNRPCIGSEMATTPRASTALFTDRYELTMLQAAIADGTVGRRCVFEVFARRLPAGRRYGVVAGTGRLLDALADFTFGDAELAQLEPFLDPATLDYLAAYRFDGDIDGYPEGELFFPGSPVLTVTGTVRHRGDPGDAGAVDPEPRLRDRLRGRPDGVGRRRPPADRDGFPAHPRGVRRSRPPGPPTWPGSPPPRTWRPAAGYGIPTAGTAAHAFTLLHRHRGGGLRLPGRDPRRRHHAAGGHLRHHPGHRDRGQGRRPRTGRRPHRLR